MGSAASPERPDSGLGAWIPEPMIQAAERIAAAGGFSGSIELRLEQAGVPIRVGEFVAGSVLAALLGVVLGSLLLGSFIFAIVFGVVGAAVPSMLLSLAIGRRTAKLQSQLADVVTILASSLRAGHSFFQALDMVSKEIGEPAGPEFQRVVAEVRLGRPVDDEEMAAWRTLSYGVCAAALIFDPRINAYTGCMYLPKLKTACFPLKQSVRTAVFS